MQRTQATSIDYWLLPTINVDSQTFIYTSLFSVDQAMSQLLESSVDARQ